MDDVIFGWINGFAGRPALDYLADSIAEDWVFTGVLQLVFFWFFWFQKPSPAGRRETLLRGLLGILLAIIVARLMSHVLPFRPRPFLTPLMHPVTIPHDIAFDQASSFPSDTSAYFVAFGTALWFVSRRVGAALVVFAMTVMTVPRVYLGLHYPSDCLAGWAIGICVPLLVMRGIPASVTGRIISWSEKQPGYFFALLFAVTAEMSNAFRDVRATLHGLAWMARTWRGLFEAIGAVAGFATLVTVGACVLTLNSRRRRETKNPPSPLTAL